MAITQDGTVRIYQAFRANNPNYFAALQPVTADNVLEVGGRIAGNSAMFEDFARVLAKVAETYVNSPNFSNPMAKHKRSVSEYGNILEDIFVGLIESSLFRGEDSAADLWKAEKPNVHSVYYTRNREEKYKVTIDNIELKRGLREEGGLSRIVDMIIASMTTSNEIDEYKYAKALIEGAYNKGELFLVEVGDVDNDVAAATKLIKKARLYSVNARYPNQYNAKGVTNVAKAESMSLYVTANATATVDVDVMAKAYNLNNSNFLGKVEEIDRFADDNLLAVYMDDSFFVIADALREVTSQFDASALKTNYWLHVHQYLARSPFATAIAFVKEIPANMKARLTVSTPVGIIAPRLNIGQPASLTIHSAMDGFDGATIDLSTYSLTATVDTAGVNVEVDGTSVTFTPSADAEPGENFTATFTATYGPEDAPLTSVTKGNYTISKNYQPE